MARRSSYDPNKDYEKLADEYLATCGREQTRLPKETEFCREYIGRDFETVRRWLEGEQLPKGVNTDALRASIKKIKETQQHQLMDDGLYGGKEVNNAMAIFLLKANHGFIETERKEFVGKDGQSLPIYIFGGGFLPPQPSAVTPPNGDPFRLPQVQSIGLAQKIKKDDNGAVGVGKTEPN